MAAFWATFGNIWDTFNFDIWSHCKLGKNAPDELAQSDDSSSNNFLGKLTQVLHQSLQGTLPISLKKNRGARAV